MGTNRTSGSIGAAAVLRRIGRVLGGDAELVGGAQRPGRFADRDASEHDDVLMRSEEPAFDAGAEPATRAEPSFTLGDVPMVDPGSGA